MRLKLISIAMAVILVLVGCQGAGDQEGTMNDPNTNIEQTRNVDFDRNRNNDNRGDIVGNRDRDRSRSNMQNINNRNNQYDVSDEAADKIVDEVAEIERAYVLTTKNNAYVAAMLDNDRDGTDVNRERNRDRDRNRANRNNRDEGEELTEDVKKQISDIVQSVDNDIDNVYVTTNPDFADLTNNYINDVNDGKPIRGMFDEIGNMIERVFPQDKR